MRTLKSRHTPLRGSTNKTRKGEYSTPSVPKWPNGAKSAAIFSFDVDGPYVMRAVYGEESYYLTQGEYDTRAGSLRILDILRKKDVKATFCVVGRIAEDVPDLVAAIKKDGHEIAAHGYDHTPYYKLSRSREKQDILKTIRALQQVTGEKPVGHRTPEWNPSSNTLTLLGEIGGFLWNSDYLNDDLPYWVPTGSESHLVEIPTAASLDDWPLIIDGGMSPAQVAEVWKQEFDVLHEEGKLFVLTVHPLLSGRPSWSKALIDTLAYACSLSDVWIATAGQIARWWEQNMPEKSHGVRVVSASLSN